MYVNKTADMPETTPVVTVAPSIYDYSLQLLTDDVEGLVTQIDYHSIAATGAAYPDDDLNLWWCKDVSDALPLYGLTVSFSAIEGASTFLASNCMYIKQTGLAEVACGLDDYEFRHILGDTAYPFKIRIVPSAAYVSENLTMTAIKMSFKNTGTPVLYGARNKFQTYVGGGRDLLRQASIYYSVLLTVNLNTSYMAEDSVSSGFTWSIS